jgi:hypothetical protein
MRLTERKRAKPRHVRERRIRLIARNRSVLTTVSATLVLAAASMLAGRGEVVDPTTGTRSVTLESGAAGVSVTDQALEVPDVPAISVRQARIRNNKGTPKLPSSALADLDIPQTALLAYQRAADVIGEVDASCGLSWTLLAAIGRVESDHGRFGGAELLTDGTSSPEIRGVALDGAGPVAQIRDTDAGKLDGDTVWDRAVGPMQFLPSTWSVVGVDGDGDGVRSPGDIDDAALATAVFLCSAPGELDTDSGRRTAIFRYNPSNAYVASVLAADRSYRAGEFETTGGLAQADSFEILATRAPDPTTDAPTGFAEQDAGRSTRAAAAPKHPSQSPAGDPTRSPDPSPTGSADPTPSPTGAADPSPTGAADPTPAGTPDPTPTGSEGPTGTPDPTPSDTGSPSPTGSPDPTPTETPDPTPDPSPAELSGVLTACEAGWCLDGVPLDVGDSDFLDDEAEANFDLDGNGEETNAEELTGLVGTTVTLVIVPGTTVVVAINGMDYDG